MAIQQFGESLLSDIRERNKREAKRLRKQEEKQAILGLGVTLAGTIGNKLLESKVQNFMNQKDTLDQRVFMKNNYTSAENIFKQGHLYDEKGLQALYEESLPTAIQGVNLSAPADASEAEKTRVAQAKAYEIALQKEKNLKLQREAATNFIQAMDGDPKSFDRALLKQQPDTVGKFITNQLAGFFTGSSTNAVDRAHADLLKERADEYYAIRQTIKNPLNAFEVAESLKGRDWKKIPPEVERGTIEELDSFTGQTTERSVERIIDGTTGRTIAMFYEGTNDPVYTPTPGRQNAKRNVQTIDSNYRNNIETTVSQVASKKDRDALENYVNEILVNNEGDAERVKNEIYGTIALTTEAIQSRLLMDYKEGDTVPTNLALQLATKMQALNIKQTTGDTAPWYRLATTEKLPGMDLFLTEDNYSPFLALAAIEELEKENTSGTRTRFSEDALAKLKYSVFTEFQSSGGRREIEKAFLNMSDMSQKNYLDWMTNYDIFTRKIGDQPPLIDILQTYYSPNVILDKDNPRHQSNRR